VAILDLCCCATGEEEEVKTPLMISKINVINNRWRREFTATVLPSSEWKHGFGNAKVKIL
jgi:hypothetical protein